MTRPDQHLALAICAAAVKAAARGEGHAVNISAALSSILAEIPE